PRGPFISLASPRVVVEPRIASAKTMKSNLDRRIIRSIKAQLICKIDNLHYRFDIAASNLARRAKQIDAPPSIYLHRRILHCSLNNSVHRFLCSAGILGAVAVVSLEAQQQQADVASVPAVAGATPPQPALPAKPPAPNRRPPPAETPVKLQFPNSDVQDVLHLYEQLTG